MRVSGRRDQVSALQSLEMFEGYVTIEHREALFPASGFLLHHQRKGGKVAGETSELERPEVAVTRFIGDHGFDHGSTDIADEVVGETPAAAQTRRPQQSLDRIEKGGFTAAVRPGNHHRPLVQRHFHGRPVGPVHQFDVFEFKHRWDLG